MILTGFTLERREDGPLLQLACPALIVAVSSRDGESRGQLARRRRRGPEGLRAASGAQVRNVSLRRPTRWLAEAAPRPGQSQPPRGACLRAAASRARRAARALEDVRESSHRQMGGRPADDQQTDDLHAVCCAG